MKTTHVLSRYISALALLTAVAGPAVAQSTHVITFDEASQNLQHGSLFSGSEYSGLGGGVTFTVDSKGRHDQLIIFDTNQSGTADPDLENPFLGGNLKGVRNLGNALIIAENLVDRNNNGLIDSPDDEAAGGRIGVIFGNSQVSAVGFSLYDTPETSKSDVTVVFKDMNGLSVTWKPSDLIANGTNVDFANHYGNHISNISASQLGLKNIQSIDFNIESGAIDNLVFHTVPEPSSLALLGLGASAWLLRRKRF
ncbi:MAG: PEP-CTERM sorting domain-containing protein [Akkermansiaceae bacterium]|nr:PEP-CTERM sorting domain-containing protein [Akkermansiaceae bacterium]